MRHAAAFQQLQPGIALHIRNIQHRLSTQPMQFRQHLLLTGGAKAITAQRGITRFVGWLRVLTLHYPPDNAIQPGYPLAGQAHNHLIAWNNVAFPPATQRANIHPPDRFIIQLNGLQIQYHRNFPGAANRKIDR